MLAGAFHEEGCFNICIAKQIQWKQEPDQVSTIFAMQSDPFNLHK